MSGGTAIAYFSATGNTRHLVSILERLLREAGASPAVQTIRHDTEPEQAFASAHTVFIAFPILGFGCPRFIEAYLKRLPSGHGRRAVLLATGADFLRVNRNAFRSPARILLRKGYQVPYRRVFAAGCNWLVRYEDGLSKQLLDSFEPKLRDTLGAVDAGERREKPGTFPLVCALTRFGEERFGGPIFGMGLRATDACTACGLCVQICPTGAAILAGDRPRFSSKCSLCMGCVYRCPEGAIQPRRLKASVVEGGYTAAAVLAADAEPTVDASTRGYFARFHAYLTDPEA